MSSIHLRLMEMACGGRLSFPLGSDEAGHFRPFLEAMERKGWLKRDDVAGLLTFSATSEGERALKLSNKASVYERRYKPKN